MPSTAEVVDLTRLGRNRGAEAAIDFDQQCGDPLGEHRHLLLLEYHRHDTFVVNGLKVKRAVARLPDGPGHEAVG